MTVGWKWCYLTCHTSYSRRSYSHHGDVHKMVQCTAAIMRPCSTQIFTTGAVWGVFCGFKPGFIFWHIQWCVLYHVFLNRAIAWWRHKMETFSALLAICAGNSPVPDELPAQGPVTGSFDVFLTNGWVNNREAGDLRRYRAHYDVTVLEPWKPSQNCMVDMSRTTHNVMSQGNLYCMLPVWFMGHRHFSLDAL